MSIIAIIPARGGSKRIPRKNIKLFMGKPMIAYAIEACLASGLFNEVMVSTDDLEIAKIAKTYGAKIPFMRSAVTSNDIATTFDVLEEVISEYANREQTFEDCCCVYPCVPFLKGDILRKAYEQYREAGLDSLVPVIRFSFPIQRAFKINSNNCLEYREPENEKKRSQDLEPMFHDVGMFYFCDTNTMLQNKSMISNNTTYIELDETHTQDIDNESDWKMAELKYRIIHEL